jgi:putative transposase
MNELAARHPRYGYRRIWALLRGEGWQVNRKRIERLWRAEEHRIPPRRSRDSGKRAQGTAANAPWNLAAAAPHDVWSYDFLATRTRNVVDEYTRVALGCRVDRSIGARDVISELESLFERHGKPKVLRSDNGREFIAASLLEWLAAQGVATAFSERGSPQQNPYVERFNSTMRDEVLRGEEFVSVLEARVVLTAWLEEYNERRPHRGLEELPRLLDRQQQVDQAGQLVTSFLGAGGDPARLVAALGSALVRENRNFHTIQCVEAASRQHELLADTHDTTLPLLAAARYLAAHATTTRAERQTFEIARQLHRGENLYENEAP